jgi:hypothetical protein
MASQKKEEKKGSMVQQLSWEVYKKSGVNRRVCSGHSRPLFLFPKMFIESREPRGPTPPAVDRRASIPFAASSASAAPPPRYRLRFAALLFPFWIFDLVKGSLEPT